jgi:hypothetical protein
MFWVSQEQVKALKGLKALVRSLRAEHSRRPTKEQCKGLVRPLRTFERPYEALKTSCGASQALRAFRPLRP